MSEDVKFESQFKLRIYFNQNLHTVSWLYTYSIAYMKPEDFSEQYVPVKDFFSPFTTQIETNKDKGSERMSYDELVFHFDTHVDVKKLCPVFDKVIDAAKKNEPLEPLKPLLKEFFKYTEAEEITQALVRVGFFEGGGAGPCQIIGEYAEDFCSSNDPNNKLASADKSFAK